MYRHFLLFLGSIAWVSTCLSQDTLTEVQLLKYRFDSVKRADSASRSQLQQQLTKLQSGSDEEKDSLNDLLRSLTEESLERDALLKAEVESLREHTEGVPIKLYGDTLFLIYARLGSFTQQARAKNIQTKLVDLASREAFDPDQLYLSRSPEGSTILYGNEILMSVTEKDAFWMNAESDSLAGVYLQRIRSSLVEKGGYDLISVVKRLAWLFGAVIAFFFLVKYLNKSFNALINRAAYRTESSFRGLHFRNYEVLSGDRVARLLKGLFSVIKWISIVVITYLTLSLVLGIFDATKSFSKNLLSYILKPLEEFGRGFISIIPQLIRTAVVLVAAYYLVKFFRFLSKEITSGKLEITGFLSEWANTTFNVFRFGIYLLAFYIISLNLPASYNQFYDGFLLLFGLLLVIGLAIPAANVFAGLIITYSRPFKDGDRIRVHGFEGEVVKKNLLVTKIKSSRREVITLPNVRLLLVPVTNLGASSVERGSLIKITVTIAYGVPWQTVHEKLLRCTGSVPGILAQPKPSVWQAGFTDKGVQYQLTAQTNQADSSAQIYSDVFGKILDAFAEDLRGGQGF